MPLAGQENSGDTELHRAQNTMANLRKRERERWTRARTRCQGLPRRDSRRPHKNAHAAVVFRMSHREPP